MWRYATGIWWPQRAVELEHDTARTNLGTIYADGLGVPRYEAEAANRFRGSRGRNGHCARGLIISQRFPTATDRNLGDHGMNVATDREEGVLTVRVEGRLDGTTVTLFEEAIGTAIDQNDRAVLIDCENLGYIGSAGLRAILVVAGILSGPNAGFALCALSRPVREVFRISGLSRIVAIHPSRAEALAAFDS